MSDVIKTTCTSCGAVKAAYVVREPIKVQLNGNGGVWSQVKLKDGDVIKCFFQLNDGQVTQVPGQYNVTEDARPGNELVAYMVFKVGEQSLPIEV